VLAWSSTPAELPRPSPPIERAFAVALLLVAVFLVFGLHLRSLIIAWQNPASLTEYASSPTPFWMVKLMDLGIVVPAAVTIGVGLLRRADWARRSAYVLLTGYTCLGVSVSAMALVMNAKNDPDASLALAAGFGLFAMVFIVLSALLYRPLFTRPPVG
jgi:hypothetical protein